MNRASKFFRFVTYDIRFGLFRKWGVYLIAVLVAIASVNWTNHGNMGGGTPAFTDYFLYLFTGIPELIVRDFFTIPFFWLGVMILPFFSIGYYAVDDLNAYGIQMIVKSRSKLFWWISKCIWCALSVLVYIAVLAGTFLIYCLATGKKIFAPAYVWHQRVGMYKILGAKEIVVHCIVLPIVTLYALCMIQMLLSLAAGTVSAYIVIIGYTVLASFVMHPVFIANYTMLSRDDILSDNGLRFINGYYISGSIIFACIIIGIVIIKNRMLFRYESR